LVDFTLLQHPSREESEQAASDCPEEGHGTERTELLILLINVHNATKLHK
jgi:hypothetical protein